MPGAAGLFAASLVFTTLSTPRGPIEYTVLLPEGPGPHRAVLALPPGGQDRAMVAEGLEPWHAELTAAGFAVVSPVAPGLLFTESASHERIPPLLEHIEQTQPIAADAWRLFGISNGGRSALVVGAAYPDRFENLTVLPGATSRPESLRPLVAMPTTFVVGSRDSGWLESSRLAHRALVGWGGDSELVVLEGQGHTAFQSVGWDQLEQWLTRSAPEGR